MERRITKARRNGLIAILLCGAFSLTWGMFLSRSIPGGVLDFQAVYYGTQCLMQHCDPYNVSELAGLYRREGREDPSEPPERRQLKTLYVNMPTAFLFIAPFAVLPWGPAHILWSALIAVSFLLAALLMWDVGAEYSPGLSATLICIVLANSEVVFATGNTAGLVVSLCVIAAWCFLHEKFAWAGVLCFVVALAVKPHDSGLVWLYFLLVGGTYRKRALQSFILTAVLCAIGLVWVSHVAPHWLPEMRANLATISSHGGLNEPGPSSVTSRTAGMIVDLQAALSIFWNSPSIYNTVSYAICGAMLIVWAFRTVRSRVTQTTAWFSLAAVVPLTLLITYHRPYDAKLLMLGIPACALLWAQGGAIGRAAGLLSIAGCTFTGDIPLASLIVIHKDLQPLVSGWPSQILTVLLTRPASLILLALAVFYLWVYVRATPAKTAGASTARRAAANTSDALSAKGT
jgi:hypothetical protein